MPLIGCPNNLKRSFGELEQRMNEIRGLEERYRDLIENSPEMIHQVDKAGRFVHANQTELQKLGYTQEEMSAMHLWDIVPKGRETDILRYLEGLMVDGRGTMETVFLTKSGKPIDVEIHSTALFDMEHGGLLYSRAFVRDITQRKVLEHEVHRYTTQLEQEVAERTQQYRTRKDNTRRCSIWPRTRSSWWQMTDGLLTSINGKSWRWVTLNRKP